MRLIVCILLGLSASRAQDGPTLFAARCGVCHGSDGRGSERGPNLAGNRRLRSRTIEQIRTVIHDGVPAAGMPAFALPPAELDAVTRFVRSLSEPAAEAHLPGDPAAGERFFMGKGRCSTCHMALGRGTAVGPDLSNIGREMTVAEIEEAIRRPSAKISPGYNRVSVRLKDGRTIEGFARNESRYNIQVQDLRGRFHLLADNQIAKVTKEGGSYMPPTQCSGSECTDLLAWLGSLTGAQPRAKPFPMKSEGGPSFDEIAHPHAGDWPTYHGEIGGNRHSSLNQITAGKTGQHAIHRSCPP